MPASIEIKDLCVSFNGTQAVKGVSFDVPAGMITAIIGPSGCGKTTLLRSINRLSEMTKDCRVNGEILVEGQSVLKMDTVMLRRKVGMVFQKPNPFPKSVKENVLYGVKAARMDTDHIDIVKVSLQKAALWDELQHRLHESAMNLSIGQQQRLCMARSLAVSPEVILLDEPASALDPASTLKLEESILRMRGSVTQVIVTHNMQQAKRLSDYTAFIYRGELMEFDATEKMFNNPGRKETRDYIDGKFS